ncbi:MAG: phosphoribosyltransferase family protein, partial [Patescibacteria group bacterium]|nr:phosphoribosyltransferase family protein [Patescibacteria group bacterium]
IMKTFKYNFRYGIMNRIIELALPQLQKHFQISDQNTILIPIPSHVKRIRHRGFNQSLIIAQGIGKEMDIRVANPLIKTIHTDHQSHKSRAERLQQKNDIYSLKPNLSVLLEGKDLVIVDDVCTTGSTLRATAQRLLNIKPRSITALTLFRASRTSGT